MILKRLAYVGVVVVLSAVPVTAFAYTPEQEQACTNDAFRVCGSEIPDVDRVTACMVRNKSQLSPPCRAQFGPEPVSETIATRAGKPMSIRPAAKKSHKAKKHADD